MVEVAGAVMVLPSIGVETLITTSSALVQEPVVIVHLNVYEPPIKPVIALLYRVLFEKVGVLGPDTTVQAPVPEVGLFPANVVEVVEQRV